MKKLLICLLFAALLIGCGKKQDTDANDKKNTDVKTGEDNSSEKDKVEPSGYPFVYNDVTIYMNTDVAPIKEALGEPAQYFEAESCAFKGLDKTYYYSGIELTTYPKEDGSDFISSINFKDDSVSTPEGIFLGSTAQNVIDAYGEDYEGGATSYTYTLGDSQLLIILEDEEVISITYLAIVEELQ
ncbi:MAG TPA: hypothetical protein VJZ06_03400 [Mobilitalea sp.]|nr:hypothetical protein [Mobilitalea sp.]